MLRPGTYSYYIFVKNHSGAYPEIYLIQSTVKCGLQVICQMQLIQNIEDKA